MDICFLDNSSVDYTSEDLDSNKLRGAETVLINLSKELYKLGNSVTVYNNCNNDCILNGVKWINLNNIKNDFIYDISITNNDMNLFNKVKSRKYIAFSHSIQSIEKFIRKRQLLSYMKFRPKIVLLSKYHSKNRNILLKLFGTIKLEWAIDEIFINTPINDGLIENRAIFTSRNDRNLDLLINIWKNHIYSRNKKTKLFVTPSSLIDNEFNIYKRNFSSRDLLIKDLLKSRVFLIPGHKGELFCLAAEEARELCVPIVTLGLGSLSERVIHGKTGFIAKDNYQFAKYTLDILEDHNTWKELRNNLIKMRGLKKWNKVAISLLNQI
tara:strand:- start:399 stop:1373 length:975 start_codon:yes stop_codon:yes gene_type:complete